LSLVINTNKMKNLKEIIIGIFAVIGVLALVTGFTNNTETQQMYATPESHVWEIIAIQVPNKINLGSVFIMWNKVTGEVRKLSGMTNLSPTNSGKYRVMQNWKKEFIPKPIKKE